MPKSDKLPAMPFYTNDYLGSINVKSCAPDVRGLYIDCICYLWGSSERGVFVDQSGNPYTEDEIIRSIGLDNQNSTKWLTTLLKKGLLKIRESDNAYYQERMVKDEEIRVKRKIAGSMGGNPNLVNQTPTIIQKEVNRFTEDETESTNEKEITFKEEKENTFKEEKENTINNNFSNIWKRYPKRIGKKEALRYFKATIKTGDDLNNIHKALDIYMSSKNVAKGYIQNGSTWFNDWETWIDYTEPVIKTAVRQKYEESLLINEERMRREQEK